MVEMEMLPKHEKLENIRKCNFISHSSNKETVTYDRATNDMRNHKDNDIIGDSDQLYYDNYNDYDDDYIDIDRGPTDLTSNDELVYYETTEMTRFMPTAISQTKETDLIKDNISPDMVKHSWKIETNPLNEYRTEYLATLSFPSLFPDAKGDPMNNASVRNISENETEAFSQKIKHLIKFAEIVNGKWVYRFASHPRFGYWAFNILYRGRLLSQGNFFIKQNPGEANLTFEELQEMLSSGSVTSKLMHYAKNVTGTNAYWNQRKEQLKATITQVGAPTISWTLSCADFHWPEFHTLFSNETGSEQLRSNVINNPHLIDWLFTNRTEKFVKWWL